jgi:hypothetical protein
MPQLKLRPEREDREPVVAVVRIENIDTGRYFSVYELCKTAALEISVALIDLRALPNEAESQPFPGGETKLAPRVGVAVLLDLEIKHVLRFFLEINNAITNSSLEPGRNPLQLTENGSDDRR